MKGMKTLNFWGSSDDLFVVSCGEGGNEISPPDDDRPAVYRVQDSAEKGSGMYVVGIYAPCNVSPCWSVGVCQLDEDVPLPDWELRIDANRYTTRLEMVVPDSVVVYPVEK